MRKRCVALIAGLVFVAACAEKANVDNIGIGTNIVVTRENGPTVTGKLIDVRPDAIVVEEREGVRTTIPRGSVSSVAVTEIPLTPQPTAAADQARPRATAGDARALSTTGSASVVRELTIPAGTVLPVQLETPVGSDISRIESPVRASLTGPIVVSGLTAIPAGADLVGSVTRAVRPGKVKGRGQIAFRFHTLEAGGEQYRVSTASIARVGRATKKKDALKIGVPAAGGAVVGGIVGGKKGAVIGGAAGGGAGTAVVLSTRGEDVRLGRGARVSVRLTEPLTVKIRG